MMDDKLVGYLLQALDPPDLQEVEAHLRTHPEARSRLALLERALAPLAADGQPPAPPPGLVLGTLARVAEYRCRGLPAAPPPAPSQVGAPGRRWARRPDVLAAAALLLLVGGLGLSALARQWRAYQREACASNLRSLWEGLERYSDHHEGDFPRVEEEGPRGVAGVFRPLLHDAGVLTGSAGLACPSQGRRPPPDTSVRDLEELFRTSPEQFRAVARDLAGGYAYSLGYEEDGTLCGPGRVLGDGMPILADCGRPDVQGNSPNHGGAGQNVLYIGGHVRWCTQRTVGPAGDDIYLNQRNELHAGLNRNDCVLGPGDAAPR
jgi:hypothetical protein